MAKKYNCKTCGAELFFDPKSGKLHCEYCGSDFEPSEYDMTEEEETKEDAQIPQEGMDAAAEEGAEATDDSVSTEDLVVYKCPHCGAEMITSQKTVATTCVYCNRAVTLTGNVRGEFRPQYILPFEKERSEVEAAYRKLCKGSFLTPRTFLADSQIQKIKGMYVPYWLYTFDGVANVTVRGSRVHTFRRGDTEITETSHYLAVEEGQGRFFRIPADGMKEMDNLMMDSIEPFHFNKLVPFNPAYLSGFYAQQWDENAAVNEPRAKTRAKNALSTEVMNHIEGFTTSVTENENYSWSDQKVEQVMLPVWMMYTEYKGENYVFGMNGQTGKMMGAIPTDTTRLLEIGGAVFIIVQIIFLIIRILGVM
ncbi:MAG: hypothetical protein Q4B09_05060 [Lachnospiraceae bacterium]|nr:hypothetical protein [Lachnospiraceae bacterium]